MGLSASSSGVVLPSQSLLRDRTAEVAARKAVTAWLDAFGRGDIASCWADTSGEFREGTGEQEWSAKALQLRARLGAAELRSELALEYGRIGGTSGNPYVTIEYRSRYALMREVVERVTTSQCGIGRWCIMGWDIAR